MKRARAVFVVVLGAALAAPAPHHACAGSDAVVVDGRDAAVGTVIAGAADPSLRYGLAERSLLWIARDVGGMPVRLLVGESGPWDTKDLEPLRYESDDCTGDALLAAPAAADGPQPAAVFDTMVLLTGGASRSHVVRSEGWPQREGDACSAELVSPRFCCARLARPETLRASPVVAIDLASLDLAPPFRVVEPRRQGR